MSADRKRKPAPRTAEPWSPEHGRLANSAKRDTLQRRTLERRARTFGLTLRHSSYGYSLVDAARNAAGGRNDMTLDDVARHLDGL